MQRAGLHAVHLVRHVSPSIDSHSNTPQRVSSNPAYRFSTRLDIHQPTMNSPDPPQRSSIACIVSRKIQDLAGRWPNKG